MPIPSKIARDLQALRDRIRADIERRDALIVAAVEAGGSLREVAELVGLTHAGVADVVRRKGH